MRIRRRKTNKRRMRGGSHHAFIGKALNYSNMNTWPGVENHGGNHYAHNNYINDMQTANYISEREGSIFPHPAPYMRGGYVYDEHRHRSKKRRSHKRSKRRKSKQYVGGGIPIVSDGASYLNAGANAISNGVRTLYGVPNTPSTLPFEGQFKGLLK